MAACISWRSPPIPWRPRRRSRRFIASPVEARGETGKHNVRRRDMKCKLSTRTRFLATCAALVAAVVGLGVPAAQAADPKPRIVFLTPVTNDFFIPVAAGLKAAAAQFGWDSQFLGPPTYDAGKEADLM